MNKSSKQSLTNEEERVADYHEHGTPTIPAAVGPDTPLSTLNLNWREKDLPERERTKHVHRLHPYLGKFIPQIVEIFLRKYCKPGQSVLDPFCGSGTTLVQANELGINSIGYDISAFNVLLSRVKVGSYDMGQARFEVMDILNKVRAASQLQSHQLPLWESDATVVSAQATDNEYLKKWYAPQALSELLTYRHYIEAGGYQYQDLLKIILSRSARSGRLTTHFDLDFPKQPQLEPYWCYKHSRECQPVQEVFKFFKRYSLDTLRRIETFSHLRSNAMIVVSHHDSRTADIPPIHAVITSPPYVGLIDYHQQHIYAYQLLGLQDRRVNEIGPAANGTGQTARQAYRADIMAVFKNAFKALYPGGRMIVIANDKHDLYGDVAQAVGMEVEDVVKRHVNRRTGRRSGEYYESVFIWRKPH